MPLIWSAQQSQLAVKSIGTHRPSWGKVRPNLKKRCIHSISHLSKGTAKVSPKVSPQTLLLLEKQAKELCTQERY